MRGVRKVWFKSVVNMDRMRMSKEDWKGNRMRLIEVGVNWGLIEDDEVDWLLEEVFKM